MDSDAKRKCAACYKVKQQADFKQKRDGFNAVCKHYSKNRKAARNGKKAELEGDSSKENTPTVAEDENEEDEHLLKEMNNLTLERQKKLH